MCQSLKSSFHIEWVDFTACNLGFDGASTVAAMIKVCTYVCMYIPTYVSLSTLIKYQVIGASEARLFLVNLMNGQTIRSSSRNGWSVMTHCCACCTLAIDNMKSAGSEGKEENRRRIIEKDLKRDRLG